MSETLNVEGTPVVAAKRSVGLLARLLCKLGKHKWRRIRRTHHNKWMGRICSLCGETQKITIRGYATCDYKLPLDNIERVAGGNKPMAYDKQPNAKLCGDKPL